MLVESGFCDAHATTATQQRRWGYKAHKTFYDSARWRRVRDAKLRNDPLCQYCLWSEKLTAATEVDHHVSLEAGGEETAEGNLISACKSCHSRKTRAEQLGHSVPPHAPSRVRTLSIS